MSISIALRLVQASYIGGKLVDHAHEPIQNVHQPPPPRPGIENHRMVQVGVTEHLQPPLTPIHLPRLLTRQIPPHRIGVDDLVLPAQRHRDHLALELLLPQDILRPKKVSSERARHVRVPARKVPQQPLIGSPRRPVHKVERHVGEVEQEGNRVDEQGRSDARCKRGTVEELRGDGGAIRVRRDDDAREGMRVEDLADRGHDRGAGEGGRGDAGADREEFGDDDANVRVMQCKIGENACVWV